MRAELDVVAMRGLDHHTSLAGRCAGSEHTRRETNLNLYAYQDDATLPL